MAVGIAELVIVCLIADWMCRKARVPGLVAMLLLGVLFGPYVMGWIDSSLLDVSGDLRLIALIVILLRAGFELSRDALNRVGRLALLLSFVPALFEGAAITAVGPMLLGLTTMQSAILGAVLAAVSPAVVVPLMIGFIEERRGAEKGIPTLILAASSIDDVFVIVLYSVLIGVYTGEHVDVAWQVARLPISIVVGIAVGLAVGWALYRLFEVFDPRATKRTLTVLGISILLVHVEHLLDPWLPFAALLAVMAIGFIILERREAMAHEISAKLGKIWVFAEILLFTMVGTQVDVRVAVGAGLAGAALIGLGLVARSIGTWLCLLGSDLTGAERLFVVIAYLPKATVQAAIGGSPLVAMRLAGMDTAPGEVILAVAVLSIVLTAPLGAWAISVAGERILEVADPSEVDALAAARASEAMEED